MAPSKIRRALGAVKDQTSIGLAKVNNTSALSDLDVAIVKATRHDEYPAEEKYLREILSLTCYSRAYISSCVSSLSRRLAKTKSWTVALKTLILVHRLLSEGDPAYEQEIFFATRQGTRMLNMSEFRDTYRSDAWDYSAFVRTYALYLDERLDFRMHGRRGRHRSRSKSVSEEDDLQAVAVVTANSSVTPVREMKTERLFLRCKHLQQLLERFLACKPTGTAKNNRIVFVALYPLVKESYQIYFDLQELISIFIDRFMELEVRDCARVHDIFTRLSKQFDELNFFYSWCKTVGVSRPSEYPEVEHISSNKLHVMDEFIRDKSALARTPKPVPEHVPEPESEPEQEPETNTIRALPAPETTDRLELTFEEKSTHSDLRESEPQEEVETEVDFLNMNENALTGQEHGDRLALALFDSGPAQPAQSAWEAFNVEGEDWEKALVVSASGLSGQKAELGGGFDMTLLDGMYSQPWQTNPNSFLDSGSSSSVAVRAPVTQPVLALPAPPGMGGNGATADPFAASLMVPPPTYVQMSEMETKQQLLMEEQRVWQQYTRDGMQGQPGMARLQNGMYNRPMF